MHPKQGLVAAFAAGVALLYLLDATTVGVVFGGVILAAGACLLARHPKRTLVTVLAGGTALAFFYSSTAVGVGVGVILVGACAYLIASGRGDRRRRGPVPT